MHAMPHLPSATAATGHGHHPNHHQATSSKPVKVKRTRQRVDAGEPRNSYASIANFSSRGGYHGYATSSHKYGSSHSNSSNSSSHHSVGSANGGVCGGSQLQHSLALASQANTNVAPHPANSAEQMFGSKQLRDQASAFNAAAMAAATSRPDMMLDPAILQMYQSQMAALLNGAYSSQQAKAAGSSLQDQFALNNAFCNANAFLNQLQSDASMANLMNNFNMESAAAAALLSTNSADAQLLRDILEAGGRATEKSSQQMGQQQSVGVKQSELSPKSKSRSSSKLFADLELDADLEMDFADSFAAKEQEDRFSLAAPGEEPHNDCGDKSGDEERHQRSGQQQGNDSAAKAKEGEGYGDGDAEALEEDAKGEAKDKIRPSGSHCGSGKEATEMASEEVAKTAAARDGNSPKEERRGRARPSPLSLSQRRAKSPPYGAFASGSTSSAGGTSSAEPTSSAPFSAKIASSADAHSATISAQLARHDCSSLLERLDPSAVADFAAAADDDDDDRLSADDTLAPSARANQSQAKRARVENIVSNMLLVTSSNGANTGATAPSSPTNLALSPLKSYADEDTDSNLTKPQTQGVNGCKKRKLYQPQQSSKLQNGSLDTEDDDIEEEEIVTAPEVEIGVEAELDESFDDTTEDRRHRSPAQADLPKDQMDHLSAAVQPRTHTPRSEHLPTKRARLSDYEREYKYQLQSQLYSMQAKIAMQQLYAQQQQQQQQAQSKSTNGPSQYARASPVNMTPSECDSNVAEEKDRQMLSKIRQGATAMAKIYDVDSLMESLKGQILSSIGHIIDTTFRSHIEANSRLEPARDNRGNELLAQMLDSKYPRSQSVKSASANAISLNNGAKSLGRDGSPFALPNEASPAPKSFAYPQSSMASGFYGKQPFYMANVNQQNIAAAYSNGASNNGLLLNGIRETPSVNSSFGRDNPSPVLPEQTEAISLVVAPKKRRNKVTDSRLTPRTGNRIARDDGRSNSVSPPLGPMHFNTASLGGMPVSLAGLQHATDFFDPSATSFPFADQTRLSSLFANGDESDLKLTNGVNGASAVANPSVVSAVAQAAAAHHLQMLAASRASPDSLSGYPGSLMASFGRGSGTGSENGGDGSETNDTQSIYDPSMPMTSTLSPMHLRKAKLMFFYVRYPSSSVLKMFFPDIKFNKNNTAQLVKWFSNFREFYYIQMEKYARQALSEGIKCPEDLNVTDDCELLRVLNLHYNRSNHIPIPDNFRGVCETTLREFFRALQQNKDTEQSWKKAIYKVIARLDDNVPDYFKNPNFMEQLE